MQSWLGDGPMRTMAETLVFCGVPTQTVLRGRVTVPQAVEDTLASTQLLPLPVTTRLQEAVFCPEEILKLGPHVHTIELNAAGGVILKVALVVHTIDGPVIGAPNARITAAKALTQP